MKKYSTSLADRVNKSEEKTVILTWKTDLFSSIQVDVTKLEKGFQIDLEAVSSGKNNTSYNHNDRLIDTFDHEDLEEALDSVINRLGLTKNSEA